MYSSAFYQLIDGSVSIWSTPWFSGWETIYDNLVIQNQPYTYPATVKDLWIPNQKAWNIPLIQSLFTTQTANEIIQTPIISSDGRDNLCWKLTPAGVCSAKSAYKHCRNNRMLPTNQRPKEVPTQIKNLLLQVWRCKTMVPRVQTFAWRLLRRALPTGKGAGRLSVHIKENCSRCGIIEDDMHLFFLCPFFKSSLVQSSLVLQV